MEIQPPNMAHIWPISYMAYMAYGWHMDMGDTSASEPASQQQLAAEISVWCSEVQYNDEAVKTFKTK